jgi:hypothetical protein
MVMVMVTVLNKLHLGGRRHPQTCRIVGPKQGNRVRNRLQQVPVARWLGEYRLLCRLSMRAGHGCRRGRCPDHSYNFIHDSPPEVDFSTRADALRHGGEVVGRSWHAYEPDDRDRRDARIREAPGAKRDADIADGYELDIRSALLNLPCFINLSDLRAHASFQAPRRSSRPRRPRANDFPDTCRTSNGAHSLS